MTTDAAVSGTVELWSAHKVAEELGMTTKAVWRYAQLGRVIPPPIRVVGSDWMKVWVADDIRRFKDGIGI